MSKPQRTPGDVTGDAHHAAILVIGVHELREHRQIRQAQDLRRRRS